MNYKMAEAEYGRYESLDGDSDRDEDENNLFSSDIIYVSTSLIKGHNVFCSVEIKKERKGLKN